MAGNGSRAGSSRASGGGVGAPPAPSAMKVNLFQQASREAQQRAGRMDQRIARRMDLVRAEEAAFRTTSAGRRVSRKRYVAYRKANAGLGTAAFARDQRSGRVTADGMARARAARVAAGRTSRRYKVPSTRLY